MDTIQWKLLSIDAKRFLHTNEPNQFIDKIGPKEAIEYAIELVSKDFESIALFELAGEKLDSDWLDIKTTWLSVLSNFNLKPVESAVEALHIAVLAPAIDICEQVSSEKLTWVSAIFKLEELASKWERPMFLVPLTSIYSLISYIGDDISHYEHIDELESEAKAIFKGILSYPKYELTSVYIPSEKLLEGLRSLYLPSSRTL